MLNNNRGDLKALLDDFVGPNSLKTIFLNQENSVQLEMQARSLA